MKTILLVLSATSTGAIWGAYGSAYTIAAILPLTINVR